MKPPLQGGEVTLTWAPRHLIKKLVLKSTRMHSRGCHTSFFPFAEDGEWGRGTLSFEPSVLLGDWRMENGELLWRTSSPPHVEGFIIFHLGLQLLSPGIHTTKSA